MHTHYFTTKIEVAFGVKIYSFVGCFVLFVFKMGDIRKHFLSDENSLWKRKNGEAAEKENLRRQHIMRRKKVMESKTYGKELTSDILPAELVL